PGADSDSNHDRDGIHANSLRRGARGQEQPCGQGPDGPSKAAFHQFVRRVEIAAEIVGKEQEADDKPARHVAKDYLQECQVRVVGKTRNTDDGEGTGLGRYDGQRDRPPWDVPVSQEVVTEGALALAKTNSEKGDPGQVGSDDEQVGSSQAQDPEFLNLRWPPPGNKVQCHSSRAWFKTLKELRQVTDSVNWSFWSRIAFGIQNSASEWFVQCEKVVR